MRKPIAPDDLTAADCAELASAARLLARVVRGRERERGARLEALAVRMEAHAASGGVFVLAGPAALPAFLDGGVTDPATKPVTWREFFAGGGV